MKFNRIRKILLYFLLSAYLTLAVGLNVFAMCAGATENNCHQSRIITCHCCHKVVTENKMSVSLKTNDCNNCAKSSKPLKSAEYSLTSNSVEFEKHLININSVADKFLLPVVFCDVGKSKFVYKPDILANKTLDALRTVVLLN